MTLKFSQFVTLCSEAYDSDLKGATIRRQRDTEARRKTPAEIKRTKTEVNPETGERKQVPVVQKQRKDAGQSRQAATKSAQQQQPTQERGSAAERQKAAAREERRKAALARRGGAKPQSSTSSSKDLSKQADKLLTKKKEEPKTEKRAYKQRNEPGSNLTTREKQRNAQNAERKEFAARKKEILAGMIADYTETHGKPPKGKARTKLVGDATKAAGIK